MNVVILGGSGVGMIAASILDRLPGNRVLGLLNDCIPVGKEVGRYKRLPVIGRSEDVHTVIRKYDSRVFIAYVGMKVQQDLIDTLESLNIPEERLLTVVAPTAVVPSGYCEIGPGCLLAPGAQLSADTTLGKNCKLLAGSFVGHDTVLEDYVSVANHACVGANNRVGRGTHIGTNASTREHVKIGRCAMVGIGSVVLRDIPERHIVVGSPARTLTVVKE